MECLQAARTVDALLGAHPPPEIVSSGDSSKFSLLLWRLCVAADTNIVPAKVRKLASHCGGVPPSDKLKGFADTPMVADPGNKVYAAVVERLIKNIEVNCPTAFAAMPPWGIHILCKMGEEKLGDVCEAVLAAANAAADAEDQRPHNWETLRGGAAPARDIVVPLLVRLVAWSGHAVHTSMGFNKDQKEVQPVSALIEMKLAEALLDNSKAKVELFSLGSFALESAIGGLSEYGQFVLKKSVGKACNDTDSSLSVTAYAEQIDRCGIWEPTCEVLGKTLAQALPQLLPWITVKSGKMMCWLCNKENTDDHIASQQHRKRSTNPRSYLVSIAPTECRLAVEAFQAEAMKNTRRSRAPTPVRKPCPSRAPRQKNKVEQVEDKKTKQKEHTEKAPPEVLQKRATQAKRADTSLQMLCQTLLEFLTYLVRQTWIVPGHDEDCRDIVCDTIQSACHLELVFYDETALLLHKRMLDVMSCNKEGLPKRNIFIQWCRRVQSHNEAVPSSDPVDIFKSLALDLLSNDLTPEQRRDPKYKVIKDKTTGEISVTQTQRSWINVILRKNLGHARVALYIFKHGVPELFNLPFRRQAPTRALLQSMLQDFMTWHASLLYSILRRPNHPGRANARMLAALGQTKWWMHGREDKETKDKVVEKDKYFKKTKDKVRIETGISKETVKHRPQKKQKVEQEKKEVDIAATKWKKSSEMQSNADQRLPMTHEEAEAQPAALAPPAAVNRIRSSSQMRAEALQERDLNSRLAAVDEYLGTLSDEQLENLKDTLNKIFRAGKVKLVPSWFSTEEKFDSFADEIRQIAKEHWLNVVIISDIAERWNQPEKEFAEAKDTDRPTKDKLTEVKQVMRVVGLGEESHDRDRKKRRRKQEALH